MMRMRWTRTRPTSTWSMRTQQTRMQSTPMRRMPWTPTQRPTTRNKGLSSTPPAGVRAIGRPFFPICPQRAPAKFARRGLWQSLHKRDLARIFVWRDLVFDEGLEFSGELIAGLGEISQHDERFHLLPALRA